MPKKQKRLPTENLPKEAEWPRLAKLEKAWAKANDDERRLFLEGLSPDFPRSQPQVPNSLIANGRYLLPSTIRRIEHIIVQRAIRPEDVAAELGVPGDGKALTRALAKGASLRLLIINALTVWLEEQEARMQR